MMSVPVPALMVAPDEPISEITMASFGRVLFGLTRSCKVTLVVAEPFVKLRN